MTEIPRFVAEFSRGNENLVDWTEKVFTRLCSGTEMRWLFFNTLSYMEHIGSYKIMATQYSEVLDYPTLKHLNEETGHAVFFKRHAERHKGAQLDYSHSALIAPAFARGYFGRLEASMVRHFGRQANYRTIYLYMSLIVEFRAVWAYEILQRCMENLHLEVSLVKLLAEEQGHLNSMVRRLDADGDFSSQTVRHFWEQEQKVYIRLISAIEKRLNSDLHTFTTDIPASSLKSDVDMGMHAETAK